MRVLITGVCGFIAHHFVEHYLKNTDWDIIGIDKLSYASRGLERLRNFNALTNPRFKIFTWDLCNELTDGMIREIGDIDIILHLAAETHVDNSIADPVPFILNNVKSTLTMLEYARKCKTLKLFLAFSTDEVFGPALGDTLYKENDRHNPTNPYSSSKSATENISTAYANTYKVPVMVVNVMNIIGERQHIEKFLPKVINSILTDEEIPIHSYPDCKTPGTRFYIHARTVADAVLFLIKNGKVGEKYNITGDREVSNLELVQIVSRFIGKPAKYRLVNYEASRPGHDLRYGLDGSKLSSMGWKHPVSIDVSLENTIKWTLKNKEWLQW